MSVLSADTLAQSRVVVLGGTSGFGLAVATEAVLAGATVVIGGRDPGRLKSAATELASLGGQVTAVRVDAAAEAPAGVGLEHFFEAAGPADHVVSMVGGAMAGGFLDAPLETIRAAVAEKFDASLRVARAAAGSIRTGGSLVLTGGAGGRPDGASGAIVGNQAVSTLVRGLALELAPGVRVNAVAPTWTPTGLWRDLPDAEREATRLQMSRLSPLSRTATVSEVACAYLFCLTCTYLTGQTITVDGGVSLL
ncbi:MAG: SDR family oxidoreductase [Nocardioides sp.]|uniref:SDR family NAD(P)-dependent oxidoreductase n=1 Tax=Nocardioides sp. TaxID=35761 RepID=UPI0039E58533